MQTYVVFLFKVKGSELTQKIYENSHTFHSDGIMKPKLLEGILHPKIKFPHPHVVPNLYDFLFCRTQKAYILLNALVATFSSYCNEQRTQKMIIKEANMSHMMVLCEKQTKNQKKKFPEELLFCTLKTISDG